MNWKILNGQGRSMLAVALGVGTFPTLASADTPAAPCDELPSGSPGIALPDLRINANTAEVLVEISACGCVEVEGLNLYVQLGDGGAVNGGTVTDPLITQLEFVAEGFVFTPVNSEPASPIPFSDHVWAGFTITRTDITSAHRPTSEGTLARLTLDTSGMRVGDSADIRVGGVLATTQPPGLDSDFAGLTTALRHGTLTVICSADVNMDGLLNGADFNAWLTAFSSGSPAADQNGDGVLNGADFNSWLTNFGIGCD